MKTHLIHHRDFYRQVWPKIFRNLSQRLCCSSPLYLGSSNLLLIVDVCCFPSLSLAPRYDLAIAAQSLRNAISAARHPSKAINVKGSPGPDIGTLEITLGASMMVGGP